MKQTSIYFGPFIYMAIPEGEKTKMEGKVTNMAETESGKKLIPHQPQI